MTMMDCNSFSISESDYQMLMTAPMDMPSLRRVVSDGSVEYNANKRSRSFSDASAACEEPTATRRKSESDVQPLKKRRRVRIQVEPMQVVEGQSTFPSKQQCWYSKEDLVSSRKLARKLSRQVNSDSVLMETYDKACATTKTDSSGIKMLQDSGDFWKQRGLERLSKGHSVARNIQVCSVKTAVLLEQSCQYLEGKKDPERLAQASLMASRPSQQFAHMLAMADQAMASRIHSEATTSPTTEAAPTA